MPVKPILVPKREAAQLLSIGLRSLEYLIRRGELTTRRIGRRVLVSRESLEVYARHDHPHKLSIVPVLKAESSGEGQRQNLSHS